MIIKPKQAGQDCTVACLPATRRAVFFDVLKLQFFKLALCGLITLAAALPLFLLQMTCDGYDMVLYQQTQQGNLTEEMAAMYVSMLQNVSAVIEIPLLLLLAAALAGVGRVVKLLAWEQPVFFWTDLWRGVRQNIRQMLALGAAVGLVRFACVYAAGRGLWGAGLLAAVVLGPLAALMMVCISVYDLPFTQQCRYALLLYVRQPLKTLAAFAAAAALFVLVGFLPGMHIRLMGGLLAGFLIPVVLLGWFCFCFGQMDRFINPQRYPELVGRGLACALEDSAEQSSRQ